MESERLHLYKDFYLALLKKYGEHQTEYVVPKGVRSPLA